MVRRSRAQSSSMFLMELVLAILFFSITSAVCVQFFVKSHLLSQDSKILSRAINECSNIAEIYDSSDSIENALLLLKADYSEINTAPDSELSAVIYYDDTFLPCKKEDAVYTLKTDFSEEDTMLRADIKVTDSGDSVIYELNTDHHIPRRTDNEKR